MSPVAVTVFSFNYRVTGSLTLNFVSGSIRQSNGSSSFSANAINVALTRKHSAEFQWAFLGSRSIIYDTRLLFYFILFLAVIAVTSYSMLSFRWLR
jgi:hypothetical protein